MSDRDEDLARARPGRVAGASANANGMLPGRLTRVESEGLSANAGQQHIAGPIGESSGIHIDGASTVAALAGAQNNNLGGDDLFGFKAPFERISVWIGEIYGAANASAGDSLARRIAAQYGAQFQEIDKRTKQDKRPAFWLHELLIAYNKVISGDGSATGVLRRMLTFMPEQFASVVRRSVRPRAQPKRRPPKPPPPVINPAVKKPRPQQARRPPKQNVPTIDPGVKRPRPVYEPATARPEVDREVVASLGGSKDADMRAVLATVPAGLRERVEPWFRILVSGNQSRRGAAASNLQRILADSRSIGPQGAKALRQAIDGMQVHFGLGGDQVLAVLKIQLKIMENPVSSNILDAMPAPIDALRPSRDTRNKNQVAVGDRTTNARAQLDGIKAKLRTGQAAGTLDREEAAKLYEMMAFIHRRYLGDNRAEHQDLETARMYRSTQAERDAAAAGKITKVKTAGPGNSMSAPSAASRQWDGIEAEKRRAIAMWEGLNDRTKIPEVPKANSLDGQTPLTRAGQGRANRINAAAGGVTLITTFVQWSVTHQRMTQLAAWRRRQKQLGREIDAEQNAPIPPHAAELVELAHHFEELAQRDPSHAAEYRSTARRVRSSIDAAKAFWNEQ